MNDFDEWDLYAEEEQTRYDAMCKEEMRLENEREREFEESQEQARIERAELADERQMEEFCNGFEWGENYELGNHERFFYDFWRGFIAGAKNAREKQEAERLNQEKELDQEKEKEEVRATNSNEDESEDNFTALVALGVFALQVATIIKLSVI